MGRIRKWTLRLVGLALLAGVIVGGGFTARAFYLANRTIFDILRDSAELREAIANLTAESQIGLAKVTEQTLVNGQIQTQLVFVVTDRNDPRKRLLQKPFTVEGDVVHFDALVVKFDRELVEDGKARALYLWRRIYGEGMAPERGLPIEEEGLEPERYREIFAIVPARERTLFWREIWALANDPTRLHKAGIKAIYGNDLYQKLEPGLIYLFKINNSGEFYIETVPDL